MDLESVYPRPGKSGAEFCFEELRARHRGWLDRSWERSKPEPQPEPEATEPVALDDAVEERQQQPLKTKSRGFKIFEDVGPAPPPANPAPAQSREKPTQQPQIIRLHDENDENAPRRTKEEDVTKRLRREERANRTRKIKVMDVKHVKNETKTIQLNLDSPVGPKKKPKKSSDRPEPTMTINTKEAMDEIYGIFNQPLPSQGDQADGEEDDSEDDYTTGDESTATGKLSATVSEYGDETRNELLGGAQEQSAVEDGQTNVTGWSDFTASKHVPREASESAPESSQSTAWDVYQDQAAPTEEDDLVVPEDDNPRTLYVPVQAEDFEPPTSQFRQMSMLPNHRLPFMTPIVEQTESSLGIATARTDNKDYFAAKTPSRKVAAPEPLDEDDAPYSSPFQEETEEMAETKRKILQPIRTKSTKGTISLGQGPAKTQIAARAKPSEAPEPVQKGPSIRDEQCNPMDPVLRQAILSQLKPSLSSYEGYYERPDTISGRTAEIKKYIKVLAKASKSGTNLDKTASTLSLPPALGLKGAEGTYTIKRQLGEGTFAPVYLAENSAANDQVNDENRPPSRLGKSAHRKHLEAIKMEDPPSTWEFYILRQAHRRLGVSRATQSIVRAHEMHLYRDECFLIEEYRGQGTLLDLLNIARVSDGGGGMDEMLAMFFTVELFRTVEALHSKQLIHGDLKGDNVLVRFDEPDIDVDWNATYFPSGAHGWASKGISLIDFGRGIDMKQFVPNVAFIADWKTTDADCAEMRELRPWTYQIDYHGLAGIIHSLLFGKYMETIGEKSGVKLGQGATKTYRIRESLKRYWQTEIWNEIFALLLNPSAHLEGEEERRMPLLRGLRGCRERMEGWLEENCERGVGLKGMIARMEGLIRERKRRHGKAL